MSTGALIVLIIIGIIAGWWLWHKFKPYFIKYDTTILFTGGLGSGKTLNAVKKTVELWKKQMFFKYRLPNFIERRIKRPIRTKVNILKCDRKLRKQFKEKTKNLTATEYNKYIKRLETYYFTNKKGVIKKYFLHKKYRQRPRIYSNIPIHYKTGFWPWSKKREWALVLDSQKILLIQKIIEYSVVLIDEVPQLANQFNWDEELCRKNLNEWITYFRHYVGGYALFTAQSESDVVVQLRRKLNQAIWCFDFKKHLFGLFYTVRMCDIMLSDNVSTMTTTQIEDNTKFNFGLFPAKGTYDTRCFRPRIKNHYINALPCEEWKEISTMKIIRIENYKSPLDKNTTERDKKRMADEIKKLETKQ